MPNPNTYGWDLVIVERTSVINKSFDASSIQIDETIPHSNGPVDVGATLGTWRIATGGSGALVTFEIPCSTLTLSQGKKSFDFKNGSFLVQARLSLVGKSGSDPNTKSLMIEVGKGAVSAQSAQFSGNDFSSFATMATAALQAWLDQQTMYPYELASITLSPKNGGGAAAALIPTSANYAYANTTDGSDGILALLCSVAGGAGKTAHLLQEVDPNALGADDAAMLVGEDVLARVLNLAVCQVHLSGATQTQLDQVSPLSYNLSLNGDR